MKHQRHIDANAAAVREERQTRGLIADIDRVVQILNSDIAAEEVAAGIFDPAQAEYPMLARTLAARRDNLGCTIAALEKRLASLQGQTEFELA
jgi:septation ring formation regulator EzrA